MVFYLAYPVVDVLEAFFASAVVSQNDTLGASVVSLRYGSEPLLAGRVPDLHFDVLAVQVDGFYLEVDACTLINAWKSDLPMVVICEFWKFSSLNLSSRHVLPTPLSPMMINFRRWSKGCYRPAIASNLSNYIMRKLF